MCLFRKAQVAAAIKNDTRSTTICTLHAHVICVHAYVTVHDKTKLTVYLEIYGAKFHGFADSLAATKIRTTKISSSPGVKFRTMKVPSEDLDGNSTKFCTSKKFPTTVGRVMTARFFWLKIVNFFITRNQKNHS